MQITGTPSERIAFWKDAKRRLTQHHVDIDRLWREMDFLTAGVPFGGNGTRTRGKKIGFDNAAFPLGDCLSGYDTVGSLKTGDINRIYQCGLVFAGPADCGTAINFTSDKWPTIRAWIESGGRLFLYTEWRDTRPPHCMSDPAAVARFLSAMGSSLAYNGFYYSCNYPLYDDLSPGAAAIASGSAMKWLCGAGVSGGATVWTASGANACVVEAIGSGFLFLHGDSDIWGSEETEEGNCEFFRRLMTYRNEDVI